MPKATDDTPKRKMGRPRKEPTSPRTGVTPTPTPTRKTPTPTRTRGKRPATPYPTTDPPTPEFYSQTDMPYKEANGYDPEAQMPATIPERKLAKKGRGGNANYPNTRGALGESEEDKVMIGNYMHQIRKAWKMPKVRSDDELISRLDEYFNACEAAGQFPTVEEMALYCGYSTDTFRDWMNGRQKGFSPQTGKIAQKSYEVMKTFDAKLAVGGKTNVISYIFRAKNYYGLSDKTEYVITPNTGDSDTMSAEDIARKYLVEGEEATSVQPDSVENI